MKRLIIILFSIVFFANCEKTNEEVEESEHDVILNLVNELRQAGCKCGNTNKPAVSKLTWDSKLEIAAQRHADDMYENSHFSHTGTDQSSFSERISDAGYTWSTCAENIAMGQQTIEEVIEDWKNSQGHCLNMMNGAFVHIAVARKGNYWVMSLAKPQ
jgi:uncharacterized protein YkwD